MNRVDSKSQLARWLFADPSSINRFLKKREKKEAQQRQESFKYQRTKHAVDFQTSLSPHLRNKNHQTVSLPEFPWWWHCRPRAGWSTSSFRSFPLLWCNRAAETPRSGAWSTWLSQSWAQRLRIMAWTPPAYGSWSWRFPERSMRCICRCDKTKRRQSGKLFTHIAVLLKWSELLKCLIIAQHYKLVS